MYEVSIAEGVGNKLHSMEGRVVCMTDIWTVNSPMVHSLTELLEISIVILYYFIVFFFFLFHSALPVCLLFLSNKLP
jgi:hypothetical protein